VKVALYVNNKMPHDVVGAPPWLSLRDRAVRVRVPRRWVLLKKLRTNGPMSVRALARAVERDYKNFTQM
jgi:predicted transcriptional regulator